MAARTTKQTRRPRAVGDTGQRYEARREQILQLAVEVFAESGFSAGTTTEIAKRAGLTQPALYHYVGSKEQLLAEIIHRMGAELSAVLESVLSRTELTPAERLATFITVRA